jgi:environmental stress-induced protein Ves
MPVEVHRRADRVPTPWANGGGITYELARWPEGTADFDWRLSVAEVATEGPFSSYPGVDRILILLSGRMRLVIDDVVRDLVPGAPISFAGECQVSAQLTDGPTMDLNVMSRRGHVVSKVDVVRGPGAHVDAGDAGWSVAFILDGSWAYGGQPLNTGDCLIGDEAFALTGSGTVVRIRLAPED